MIDFYTITIMYINIQHCLVSELNNTMVSDMMELAWLKPDPATKRSLTSDHPAR